jgi:hypothetical protein
MHKFNLLQKLDARKRCLQPPALSSRGGKGSLESFHFEWLLEIIQNARAHYLWRGECERGRLLLARRA